MKSFTLFVVVVLAALALSSSTARAATIAELAAATPDLSTLLAAVSAANLTTELNDTSVQLTVFAPTNQAFSTLLGELKLTPQELLSDKNTLRSVLFTHVVPGVFKSTDLTNGQVLQTLLPGETLEVTKNATGLFISPSDSRMPPSKVTTADVVASNGVVHLIDAVLVPSYPAVSVAAPAPEPEPRMP